MTTTLAWIDYLIMLIYLAFVLGIGFALKKFMKTSTDFFLSGRSIPAWVAGLAFISANLGAQEVIGMAASGAKYGIATSHFYWVGAIPAMVFVGLFMMPFYYGSRAHSVPEYLRLRFDEKTRGLNAITFAVMTIFSSGISMYAMAKLIMLLHIFDAPVLALGLPPRLDLPRQHHPVGPDRAGVRLPRRTDQRDLQRSAPVLPDRRRFPSPGAAGPQERRRLVGAADDVGEHEQGSVHAHLGRHGARQHQPAGRRVVRAGDGAGIRAVVRLLVHRLPGRAAGDGGRLDDLGPAHAADRGGAQDVLPVPGDPAGPDRNRAAHSRRSRRLAAGADGAATTIPAIQGIIPAKVDYWSGKLELDKNGQPVADYDMAIPQMLLHYFPTGMLGLGLTALLASFMSGMAGNVTAFNTVWTYDIYKAYVHPSASDRHYLWMGRFATFFGTVISIGAAYLVSRFNNIMDALQLVFGFVNAPLFATFLLGMFWKRATGHGAFAGLLAGTGAAAIFHGLNLPRGAEVGIKGGWLTALAGGGPLYAFPTEMAQNFWMAIVAWTICFVVTIVVSLLTRPRPDGELVGLVYALTDKPQEGHLTWYQRPLALGVIVLLMTLALNFLFY